MAKTTVRRRAKSADKPAGQRKPQSKNPASPWSISRRRTVGREEKRAAILSAAARLFVRDGFSNVTLDRLADEIGVTKPTLYYYVRDKDDLLYQCAETAASHIIALLAQAEDHQGSGLERVLFFLSRYVEYVVSDECRYLTMLDESALSDAGREEIKSIRRRITEAMDALMRRGMADGSIRAPSARMATLVTFGVLNWLPRWYNGRSKLTIDEVADQVASLIVNGLSPR